jgi:initiation factor 1A
MVKNQNGGKNSKKMGRKFVTNPSSNNRKIRKAEEEGEIYAIVTKMLGNGMFYANDIEGKERLCIMRNKFRGRGKRDNTVALGSWVLIGIREFELCAKPKHDLLEVYSDIEKQKLKHSGDPIFSKLRSDFDSKNDSNNEADGLVFDNGEDDKYNELLETVYANTELDADPDLDSGDEKTPPSTSTTSNNKIKNKMNNNKNKNIRPTLVTMDDGDEIDVDDI